MSELLAENSRKKGVRSVRGRLPSGQPNPVDVHLGQRLRQRRILLGVSQEELGLAVGLTFQQIQKYEYGLNRVGTSRLWDLSRALGCPVAYFFEDMDGKTADASPRHLQAGYQGLSDTELHSLGEAQASADSSSRREALMLVRAYTAIKKASVRRQILDLACSLSRATP